ncbi:hypothetical protein OF83DRAFT_1170997 [Amylostereum chailletii]|nr:hypothetical protein OF83DRAFT_1170997 [Amylostereum chailletii]
MSTANQAAASSGLRRCGRIAGNLIASSSTSPLLSHAPVAPIQPTTAPLISPTTPKRSAIAHASLLNGSKSTPIQHKASGTDRFAFRLEGQLSKSKYIQLARETAFQILGPMPIHQWTSEFTCYTLPRPHDMQMDIDVPRNLDQEDEWIYITEEMNICPSIYFRNTCTQGGKFHVENRKPDAAGLLASMRHIQDINELIKGLWPGMELPVEWKSEDPWQDPPRTGKVCRKKIRFNRTTKEALAIRGQLIEYALAMFTSQYRVFAFVVLIINEHARLIRFDRAGAVVSEKFQWRVRDSPMADFLWRFDHMSPRERGHDTTVWIPSDEEVAKAREAFSTCKVVKIDLDVEHLHKFYIYDDPTRTRRAYLASSVRCYSQSLTGRGTSGFVAVDLVTGDVVWIKDTWRISLPGFPSEGEVYARLKKANVPHIPNVLRHGDVLCIPVHDDRPQHPTTSHSVEMQGYDEPVDAYAYEFQSTSTHKYVDEDWVCGPRERYKELLYPQSHNRTVLDTVGRPVTTFSTTNELVTVVRDAAEAHEAAYLQADTLHRDLSIANIVITAKGRGMLVDWDFSILVTVSSPTIPRRLFKTGTWQFVSGLLLDVNDKGLHKYHHDQESIVLVLTYAITRYRPTTTRDLLDSMGQVFDNSSTYRVAGGHHQGGKGKISFFGGTTFTIAELTGSICDPCLALIEALRSVFWDGYYHQQTSARDGGPIQTQARKQLSTPGWLVQCFDTHLAEPGWPSDDGSIDQVQALRAAGNHETHKRKRPTVYDADFSGKAVPNLPLVHTVARIRTAPPALPLRKKPRLETVESEDES